MVFFFILLVVFIDCWLKEAIDVYVLLYVLSVLGVVLFLITVTYVTP